MATTEVPEINARLLRAAGCRVIYRDGRVIVSDPGIGDKIRVISTSIDGGRWMRRPLSEWTPATVLERREIESVAVSCYCSSLPGTGCDFCGGVRTAMMGGERFASIWERRGMQNVVEHLLTLTERRAVKAEWDLMDGTSTWEMAFHAMWRRADPAGHAARFGRTFYASEASMLADDDDEVNA